MTTTYRVDGMSCEGCKHAVTNAIRAAAPGAGIDIDLARGLVTVAGGTDAAVIRQAVETAGFDFAGVVSPGEA